MDSSVPRDRDEQGMTTGRRAPRQRRSRARVEQILETAAGLLNEGGQTALSTRTLAERSGVPLATIYRYFDSSDAIIAAFLDREMEIIDRECVTAVLELEHVTLRSMTEAVLTAHMLHHERNPTAVHLWFDAQRSAEVRARICKQDMRLASWFEHAVHAAGLVHDDAPPWGGAFLVRLADRMFEFAFAECEVPGAHREIVAGFIDMIAGRLERHATPAGIAGISGQEFVRLLGTMPAHVTVD